MEINCGDIGTENILTHLIAIIQLCMLTQNVIRKQHVSATLGSQE